MMLRMAGFIRRHMFGIGIVLLEICVGLIGVYAAEIATRFQVRVIPDLWLFILIGAFFVSGLSLSIVGSLRNRGEMTPRQRERDRRLKAHFDGMQNVSTDISPTLKDDSGRICWPGNSLGNLTKLSVEFGAHFPQETMQWDTYCKNIKAHDEKYGEFLKKIRVSFTSVGLHWIDNPSYPKSPGISTDIYTPLFLWWNCRYNHSANLAVDFEKVSSELWSQGQKYTDSNHLFISGYANYIAYFNNESDKKKCRDAIATVAFNADYEKEAANLISSANELLKSVSKLKAQLSSKMQDVDKYWPGIKGYTFKRKGQCPECGKMP